MTSELPFGRWHSPLTPEAAAAGKVSLSELCSDGSSLYWLESRPADAGRVVFVWTSGGDVQDLSPVGVSIRSRVNEYGGGAVCLVPHAAEGAFAYVDLSDQRVWFMDGPGAKPRAMSAEPPDGQVWGHGGLAASADGRWVLAVREAHTPDAGAPTRCIVAFATSEAADAVMETVLACGHDFYGAPRLDAGSTRLASIVWDHPDMPWDASTLEVTPVEEVVDAATGASRLVATGPPITLAGGPGESVGQPSWGHDGDLLFVSDRHGWWQPHRLGAMADAEPPVRLSDLAAEFHGPDFVLGLRTMARLPDGTVGARLTTQGRDGLVLLADHTSATKGATASMVTLDQPCTAISAVCAHGDGLAIIGATPDAPTDVWLVSTNPDEPAVRIRPPVRTSLDPGDISIGEPFTVTGESGRQVFATFYPPTLSGVGGPGDARPPLIVWCHGGPTSSALNGFDPALQFFTSRGFAVACVDYAGSTGHGRAFRCSLWGQWGVFDSEDCLSVARMLAAEGRVDATRMAIRGGSAGGLTALNALCEGDGFRAAVSWYGVTDLLALAAATHDFEAHYLDHLVGPLPQDRAVYEARSPVNRALAMHGSVLLLQGADDVVVPPSQAEHLWRALTAAGLHGELRSFPGEGHGFRRAETLAECLQAELEFYQRELDL